ncbi:two pore domain potassium channel family protein [Nocardia cyriacigeorgica]|uniref:Two pore domain potassium channel family protein n=1 Tax=Nocardia cyriacigeorgica TaxID=135487 RepID=A0A6P1CVL8_9NOCA|nr:potassium channel family protein [Nocardia cyriacigeorgica]NEW34175.1 two pore domain potassium channel family protein [Nocardia cyriacigeorgica]
MTETAQPSKRAHALRNIATVVCALLLYYFVPVGYDFADDWPGRILTLLAFAAGVIGLGWLGYRRISQYIAAMEDTTRRIDGLLLLVSVVVVFFALFYYVLDQRDPGQFDGIETRTDALYYTVSTLATVGYGDIHAVGQVARVASTVQMLFDLVVIGTVVAVLTTSITRRLEARHATGPDAN